MPLPSRRNPSSTSPFLLRRLFADSWQSTIIRIATLASKALLLLFFLGPMPPEQIGIFGLMTVSIAISVSLLGVDYYIFNSRELLGQTTAPQVILVRDQLVVHSIVYIICLPLLSILFILGPLDFQLAYWFYVILIFEHLATESFRLLITLGRPVAANVVQFLRSGAWIYPLLIHVYSTDNSVHLDLLWHYWATGGFISLVLSSYLLLAHFNWREGRGTPIDWWRIRLGFRNSLLFFCGTIFLRLHEFSDRYILQHYLGEAQLGVYTIYTQITSVILTLVTTGVVLILYPRIVSSYQDSQIDVYQSTMRQLASTVALTTCLLSLATLAASFIVFRNMADPVYLSNFGALIVLVMSNFITMITTVPNYSLYVRKLDRLIVSGTFLSLLLNFVLNLIAIPAWGIYGAASVSLTSATLSLVWYRVSFLFLREKTRDAY